MVELHRLRLLVELCHRHTMAAVAAATGYSTSAVSHQLAVLEREAGTTLLERDGRRVRLTPAGQRLVDRADLILAAVEAARLELRDGDNPVGVVRVGSFQSVLLPGVVPAVHRLADAAPGVEVQLHEAEPHEVAIMLHEDRLDLGLVFDYGVRPRYQPDLDTRLLGTETMSVVVPSGSPLADPMHGTADIRRFAEVGWIMDSRASEHEEELIRWYCGQAGFQPRLVHRIDSLRLVQELVAHGQGVALIPRLGLRRDDPRITHIPATGDALTRRMFLQVRPGRGQWPPVRRVADELLLTVPECLA
ncbi:LysR family transcriptional regulator [Pseudonocardiaceae bacterium YIM PH 21723]|nr:LysR family transcriptional regulator [Pseudonocardiaceae bacterium YIM PH 21723]